MSLDFKLSRKRHVFSSVSLFFEVFSLLVKCFNLEWFPIFNVLLYFSNAIPVLLWIESNILLEPLFCLFKAFPVLFVILSNLHLVVVGLALARMEL